MNKEKIKMLTKAMQERGITQKQLAQELNLKPATVSHYMTSKRKFPYEKFEQALQFVLQEPIINNEDIFTSIEDTLINIQDDIVVSQIEENQERKRIETLFQKIDIDYQKEKLKLEYLRKNILIGFEFFSENEEESNILRNHLKKIKSPKLLQEIDYIVNNERISNEGRGYAAKKIIKELEKLTAQVK